MHLISHSFRFLVVEKQGEAAFTVLSHGLFRGVRSIFSRVTDTEDVNSREGGGGGRAQYAMPKLTNY